MLIRQVHTNFKRLSKEWDQALEAVRVLDARIGRTPELQRFYASIDRFQRLPTCCRNEPAVP